MGPQRRKDRSWILPVMLLAMVVGTMIMGSRWREDAYQEFPVYHNDLKVRGLAVVSVSEDAYPNLFQVVGADGEDLVVQRSVDVLVFKVPENGQAILKTMNCFLCPVGAETYAAIQAPVVAGNFLGPRGEKLDKNQAKDLYADDLRPETGPGAVIKSLLQAIFYPQTSVEEDW